jgi:parvulin-like peptidyl-prolyl isomerase
MKCKLLYLVFLLLLSSWNCANESNKEKQAKTKREAEIQAQEARTRKLNQKIVLSINNKNFSNQDLKKFIENQYPSINSLQNNNQLLSRIFDGYIKQALLLRKIESVKMNLEDIEIKEFLDTVQIDKDFQPELIKDNIKIQKYLYFSLYNNITVSENEIRLYYNRHKAEFKKNDEVLLHQIFVKDKDKSTHISGILKNFPGKFEETARQQSEAPEAKDNGLMGYFERGTLPKEMENVVFSLKINEISPVVESPYGFHIFKITKRRNKRTLYLSAVREEIRKKILTEKMRTAFEVFFDNLKQNAQITIFYQHLFFNYLPAKGEKNDEIS